MAASQPEGPPPDAPQPAVDLEPLVLELRIHGVSNTPPRSMLDLRDDAITQVDGDQLGSFWAPTPQTLARLREVDRGYVPAGIQREAYSWGGLARTSIGGTSFVGRALAIAGRMGWSLLIPFGLINVAYWTRRLGETAPPPDGHDESPAWLSLTWTARGRAASLRLVALLMTMVTAITAAVLSLDFLGVQCFSATSARCSGLPGWSDFLYTWPLSRRLALFSFAPLLVFVFLWYLASRSRTRYERATRDQTYGQGGAQERTPDASTARPRWPLLSTPGFWNHAVISSATATLHLSAIATYTALATAWHMRFAGPTDCGAFATVFSDACRTETATADPTVGSMWLILACVVVLALVVSLVVVRTEDAADITGPTSEELAGMHWVRVALRHPNAVRLVAVLSGLLFTIQAGVLAFSDVSTPLSAGASASGARVSMVGPGAALVVVLAVQVGVSLSALSWRYVGNAYPTVAGAILAGGLIASGALQGSQASTGPAYRWVAWVVALGSLVVVLVPVFRAGGGMTGPTRRHEMWAGAAPGVLLLLGALLAMVLASGLVVTVGNVLNGNLSSGSLAGLPQRAAPAVGATCESACPEPQPLLLTAPGPYVWFGALLLVAIVGCVIVGIGVFAGQWARGGRASAKGAPRPTVPNAAAAPPAPARSRGMRGGHQSDTIPSSGPLYRAVVTARARARQAHRAEKALAVATYGATVALAGALTSTVVPSGDTAAADLLGTLMGWGMWVLIGVGAGLIAVASGAGAPTAQRPMGLLWDLICFLPRAGHPFGPPCYAERVVPELLGRYRWWLTQEGRLSDDELTRTPRTVLVSAHSLGTVLAVATILGAPQQNSFVPKLSLLTYGTQLRAYFSRLFPELLGPDVLGVPACRPSDLTHSDPWHTARAADNAPGAAPLVVQSGSVRAQLGGSPSAAGRWRSLWHLTDPIGFPVGSFPADPFDPGDGLFDWYAEEVDRTAYLIEPLGHSDYPRTLAYARAVEDLSGVPWLTGSPP